MPAGVARTIKLSTSILSIDERYGSRCNSHFPRPEKIHSIGGLLAPMRSMSPHLEPIQPCGGTASQGRSRKPLIRRGEVSEIQNQIGRRPVSL